MKQIKKIVMLTILLLINTGCWDHTELSDLAIVIAIGIDITEEDEYKVGVQIMNPTSSPSGHGGGGDEQPPFSYFEETGKSIDEALSNIQFTIPKQLYIGHTNIIIIGEELAREGLHHVTDFFLRNKESRKVFPLLVVQGGTASSILETITPLDPFTGPNIKETLELTARNKTMVSNRLFHQILECLYIEGREATSSSIIIIEKEEEGKKEEQKSEGSGPPIPPVLLKLGGSAAYIEDKLVGFYTETESLGQAFIRNTLERAVLSFSCDDEGNYASYSIEKTSTELKTSEIDDAPFTTIDVKNTGLLSEFNCKFDMRKKKNSKKIEKMIEDEITKIIDSTVVRTQQDFKSDTLGFGEKFYRYQYKDWQKYKKNWNDTFTNVEYEIKVKTTIRSISSSINPAKKEG